MAPARLFAHQACNDAVTSSCEVFPASLIAGSCGFSQASLLEIASAEREAPRVSFP